MKDETTYTTAPITPNGDCVLIHNFGPRTLYYKGVEVKPGMMINGPKKIEIENYGPKEIKVGDQVIPPGEKIWLDIEECQREAMQPGSDLYEMTREHWRVTHDRDGFELPIKKGKGPLWVTNLLIWIYAGAGIGVTVFCIWAVWRFVNG